MARRILQRLAADAVSHRALFAFLNIQFLSSVSYHSVMMMQAVHYLFARARRACRGASILIRVLRGAIRRATPGAGRFCRANQGSVAIVIALALVPLLGLMGAALDYARAGKVRTKLTGLADAAALAAVSKNALGTTAAQAKTTALNEFNTQLASLAGFTLGNVAATVTDTSNNRTAIVTYTAKVPTTLLGVLGINNITVGTTSTAQASLPIYTDFYLLLDGSPSMGIGATPTDIAKIAAVNNGCGFACHSPAATPANYPGYVQPNVPGATLRIDVLKSAAQQVISAAQSNQAVANQFRVGLYTFVGTVSTLTDLTTNLAQAQAATNTIALPTTDVGTQIGDSVNWLGVHKVTSSGNGTSGSPVKFVFLITDGVEDWGSDYTPGPYDNLANPRGYWQGQPCCGAILPAACNAIKNKGVTLAVLYTTYDPLNAPLYTQLVQPYANNIAPALQACASPGFFFQADYSSEILTAVQAMFAQAIAQSARLSK
jgi:Flp pilus assembly protein TadG